MWEYNIIQTLGDAPVYERFQEINKQGKKNWELVSVYFNEGEYPHESYWEYTFKRKKDESKRINKQAEGV